jgi:hypothetical protein
VIIGGTCSRLVVRSEMLKAGIRVGIIGACRNGGSRQCKEGQQGLHAKDDERGRRRRMRSAVLCVLEDDKEHCCNNQVGSKRRTLSNVGYPSIFALLKVERCLDSTPTQKILPTG